jgi:predicted HTH domain antitoxin
MTDLPLAAQVDLWRQKVLAGTITNEELRAAIEALRAGRMSVNNASRMKKGPAKSGEDMLAELDGL